MIKNFYNLDDIRSIPIIEVCHMYGVRIERGNKCKLRDEKHASTQLYLRDKDGYDRFWDFGTNEGGDVIKLVSVLENCEWQEALEALAQSFNIQPVNNTEYAKKGELTDYQYAMLGVYGDLATKNLDIDLERFSLESAQKLSDKYHMSLNELREKYPDVYRKRILNERIRPYVKDLRNDYYKDLYYHYRIAKELNIEHPEELDQHSLERFEDAAKNLDYVERLLHKAAIGTSVADDLEFIHYEPIKDYSRVISGKQQFEVGNVAYNDIKREAGRNGEYICYKIVSDNDYMALNVGLLKDVPHAAFMQGNKVNVAVLPENADEIDRCVEVLRLKEEFEKSSEYKKHKETMSMER